MLMLDAYDVGCSTADHVNHGLCFWHHIAFRASSEPDAICASLLSCDYSPFANVMDNNVRLISVNL
jgi:hypothetical protein